MRLIDADALIEYMGGILSDLREMYGNYDHYTDGFERALCLAEDAPTIDAVPVMRCKDCKHGELDEAERDDYYLCYHHGCDWNDGDHFCSYGERKSDGLQRKTD